MVSYIKAVPLLAVAALFIAACTVSGGVSVGPGHLECSDDGAICDVDDDCCSFVCAGGVCATPVAGCFEDNEVCGTDGDCCSDVCFSDGYCGFPPDTVVTCGDSGADCDVDADCCTFNCGAGGICDAVEVVGCNLDNEPCDVDPDCCSELCADDGYCGLP